jgi:hypothetical protein
MKGNNGLKTCVKPFSLPDGTQAESNLEDLWDTFACASGNFDTINGHQYCMPTFKTITSTTKVQKPTANCFSKRFNNPNDLSHFDIQKEKPKCGVNPNGDHYCPEWNGDGFYSEVVKALTPILQGGVKCHKEEGYFSGWACADLMQKLGPNHHVMYIFWWMINQNIPKAQWFHVFNS